MKSLNIYIGSYVNDLRVGGYGVVIEYKGKINELFAYNYPTTKYRIMLSGVIAALIVLPEPCEATICVDSEYITNGINKGWAVQWRKQNWRIHNGAKAKNADLWEMLLNLLEMQNVYFICMKKLNCGQANGSNYYLHCEKLAIEAVRKGIKNAYNHKIML